MRAGSKLRAPLAWIACVCAACGASQPSPDDASSATRATAAELQRSPDIEPPPWRDEATSNALPEVASADAQIVAALETIVNAELNLALVALQRASRADVRELGSRAAKEFGSARARLSEAESLHAVRRTETPAVAALRGAVAQSLPGLLAVPAAEFDAAYLHTLELTISQQVALMEKLPTDARWAELRVEAADLRARLEGMRAAAQRLEER